ncbi:MAG: AAA family ATPase [Succinivibrionaceae bacterium]|nr:AAA family ATPase [Succinivibrionaceae bacterium]MCI6199170.1 ATP-binding protein [Pseudomonadota bacterium]MDD6546322.1 AAA family ATPase [Pseudomonadota bacterium]MDY3145744.1 AAA family ATPase [Succinivibrionaceae bacterium]MDY6273745.1 AAA family ATPase [Succinivibrionaceae bacterium]
MRKIAQTKSFKNLIDSDCIYIDKTEQIFNLLQTDRIFISRPRRFGKSLMLDTIGTLFESGVDPYFRNTWIYDKWTDSKYPVLRFDFLKYTEDYKEFANLFCKNVRLFARKLDITDSITAKPSPVEVMFDLLKALNEHGIRIVILIDEYDSQLAANINDPELYEKFRIQLRNLYGVMKDDPSIRFLGITGVTRLKDVSIFSAGSDINDLSYYKPVSTIAGFTREEIRKYYTDYIDLAVSLEKGKPQEQVTESERDELLDRLSEEYDGYCFDSFYENKVFSTWSVIKFFKETAETRMMVFRNYWYDNGGMPTVLAKYLETHSIRLEDYAGDIDVGFSDFWDPSSLLDMRQEVLMCQIGYLTVKSPVPDGNQVTIGIPNKEVRRSFEKILVRRIFVRADFSRIRNERLFSEASPADIVQRLNELFNTISYENYQHIDEKTIQGMLHAYFIGADQPVRTEVQSAAGRSDIILEYDSRRLVLELKYAGSEADCGRKLSEAVGQIKARKYGDTLPRKPVLKLALVFNGDSSVRQFTHYEEVKDQD